MSLKAKVSEDLKSAMKEKNVAKLGILRVLKAEIERNEQTAAGKIDLPDADVVKLVKKLVEGIKETTKDQTEIDVLEAYLPSQLTESAIRMIVGTVKQAGFHQMGDFMSFFKTHHNGQYDGKLLSTIVKETLA